MRTKMEDKIMTFDIETTGLKPWFGDRITCICAKTQSTEFKMACEDEKELLISFADSLLKYLNFVSKREVKKGMLF